MREYIKNSINKKQLLLAAVLFVALGAIVYAAAYYRVNAGTVTQVDEWGVCRNVSNSSGGPGTFVPTNTAGEWGSFISNAPSNISLSSCSAATYGTYGTCVCQDLNPDGTDGDYMALNICGVLGGNCSWACNFQQVLPADGTIMWISGCSSSCNNSGCS